MPRSLPASRATTPATALCTWIRSGGWVRSWASSARSEPKMRSGLSELRSAGSVVVWTPSSRRACSRKVPSSPPMTAEKQTWPRKARHSSITWVCAPPISPLVMTSRTCRWRVDPRVKSEDGSGGVIPAKAGIRVLLVAIRVAGLPAPGICAHAVHVQPGLPAQFALGKAGVSAKDGYVARTAVHKPVGNGHAVDPRKGIGQFFNAHPPAGAEVDRDAGLLVLQVAQRRQVALGQIDHMDVVTHPGAIGCGVVIAEDAEELTLAHGHLGDEGHQVVGDAIGVFADQTTLVRAHRVEVAQDRHLPARVGRLQVAQDVLAHQLGAAIGVGDLQLARFGDRHGVGITIDGGRGAEDDAAHVGAVHGLQQGQGAADVVVEVAYRLGHRFAHGLEAGKVDHAIDAVPGKDLVQCCTIAYIGLDKMEAGTTELIEPVEYLDAAVAQVVHDDHLVAGLHEFDCGV